jgi:hypothetical protein
MPTVLAQVELAVHFKGCCTRLAESESNGETGMKLVASVTIALAVASPAVASPAVGKEPCPTNKYQSPYPWLIDQLMDGDEYADVYIDVDGVGKPVACRIGQNNIPGDEKFFVCKAFEEQWATSPPSRNSTIGPPPANLPAHSQIKGTAYRRFVAYGGKHEKAEREARKQFFLQHPEERSQCYPNED